MIQRIALLAGGLGAAAVLAFALGAGNLITFGAGGTAATADSQPALPDAAVADSTVAADTTAAASDQTRSDTTAQTKTKTVVDKVYIAPTPAPTVTHTTPGTQPAPPATTKPAPPAAAAPRGNDDGGYPDDSDGRQSEREGAHNGSGHEHGDD